MKIEKCYLDIAARIVTARFTRDMTQEQLAKKVGISRPSLANIEAGRQRVMLHDIERFAKALKKKPTYFLKELL